MPSEIATAFRDSRTAFAAVGLFSAVVNVLSLTGAIFMLEVYDRVLPSRSVPTLLGLLIIAGVLYLNQAVLDVIRGRMLIRIGSALDARLSHRIQEVMAEMPLRAGGQVEGQRALRDLDQIRGFLSSGGPSAFFDLPWMPVYLLICLMFHVWIFIVALAGACILAALAWLAEARARPPVQSAALIDRRRLSLLLAIARNAEAVASMGMRGRLLQIWGKTNLDYVAKQQSAADVTISLGAVSRVLRISLQSIVLGVGAYLVIQQQATAGIIVASSIITARALAPVELAIAHWRAFLATRDSLTRLELALAASPPSTARLVLPPPAAELTVEGVSIMPPGSKRLVVEDVSFTLKSGQAVAVLGPSASGKSTLARAIVGVWAPAGGRVQLDGAATDQWDREMLGRYIGYMPQDIELFEGTVADNIARFDINRSPEAIYAAAQAAAVHDLIVHLPSGYDTEIGENGAVLSAGQRQRIALARALYGDPFLVVLDEPNAHLDPDGEAAVLHAIATVRQRGGIVVVVAHRQGVLAQASHMLLMREGRGVGFGPRDEILAKHFRLVRPDARRA